MTAPLQAPLHGLQLWPMVSFCGGLLWTVASFRYHPLLHSGLLHGLHVEICLGHLLPFFTDLVVSGIVPLYIFFTRLQLFPHSNFYPFLSILLQAPPSVVQWLSSGQQLVPVGAGWSWLLSNLGPLTEATRAASLIAKHCCKSPVKYQAVLSTSFIMAI